MRTIRGIDFFTGSREELLPGFSPDFPYIVTCAELDQYDKRFVPWHWHKTVELFYIEQGELEYSTSSGRYLFPEGSGGMVNSNVLHMTRPQNGKTVQLLHIFDTSFIAGMQGSRIEKKYITPMITSKNLDIIALYPDNPAHMRILELIKNVFGFPEQEFGYEIKLREALSEIWLALFEVSSSAMKEKDENSNANEKLKLMMVFVHENYARKISVSEIAEASYMSERDCFRVFHDCLGITPTGYITNYRLQMACHMLANNKDTATEISHACGLGSSSYFGKVFREHMGLTPLEYRCKWQNNNIKGQKRDI